MRTNGKASRYGLRRRNKKWPTPTRTDPSSRFRPYSTGSARNSASTGIGQGDVQRFLERLRRQAGGIRGSAGPGRTLSQRAIDRVRRALAARRHHTENAELAAAIKFTQRGKRRSSPLSTEARLDPHR